MKSNAPERRHTAFATPLGVCALAWSPEGIVAVQLPEASDEATASRLAARAGSRACEGAPPAWVVDAMRAMCDSVGGVDRSLADLPLDLRGVPPFHAEVYAHVARRVGAGTTATYGEVAKALGRPGGARAVGQAMAKNPVPVLVPCHRVLPGSGGLGGFSAHGGAVTKAKMLAREGVVVGAPGAPRPCALSDPRFDAAAVTAWLASRDPKLGALIARVGPFGMTVAPRGIYEAVARAVVYQQLTGKAAATIFARVCALGGGELPAPGALVALPDEALRAAGLSTAKTAALKDLAARAVAGRVPTREEALALDDDALVARLSEVRGVGRWTVEMLLMFNLGRPDVFSLGDYGLKKGMQRVHGGRELPSTARMTRLAARWAPWRSVASWYLWRASELPAG